jgi:putative endonuclease
MAATRRQKLGKQGEFIAVEYIKWKGYAILAQNYRWKQGEIDIIAQKMEHIIFVEVKTGVFTHHLGMPETWVNPHKQRQLAQTALKYIQSQQIQNLDYRFDVIAITYLFGNWYVKHIENAFWV